VGASLSKLNSDLAHLETATLSEAHSEPTPVFGDEIDTSGFNCSLDLINGMFAPPYFTVHGLKPRNRRFGHS
jgi:hypothetical protein